jgi:hypothetical protein
MHLLHYSFFLGYVEPNFHMLILCLLHVAYIGFAEFSLHM